MREGPSQGKNEKLEGNDCALTPAKRLICANNSKLFFLVSLLYEELPPLASRGHR